MPLHLQPVEEQDLPQYYEIAYEALSENGPYAPVYPHGFTPADRDHMANALLQDWRAAPGRNFLIKIVDSDLPTDRNIVGVSRWVLYDSPETLEQETSEKEARAKRDRDAGLAAFPPNMESEFRQALLGLFTQQKKLHMAGQAFMHVQLVAIRRAAQRRGIAGLFLEWGTQKTDELGLPAYVESTLAGERLYARHGFVATGPKLYVQGRPEWAEDERGAHQIMKRPARGT